MYGGGESASVYVQGYLAWVRGDSVSTVTGHAGLLLRAVLGRLGGRRGGGRGEAEGKRKGGGCDYSREGLKFIKIRCDYSWEGLKFVKKTCNYS